MLNNLPEEMKNLENFLLWKLVIAADGKSKKVPIHPTSHYQCSPIGSKNHVTFHQAKEQIKKHPQFGLGFYINKESNITCIDYDGVLDEHGFILPQYEDTVLQQVDDFNSYTEVSQSGRGLHVFIFGQPSGTRTRKANSPFPIEIYGDQRFMAVTGNIWNGYSNLRNAQDLLDGLYNSVFEGEIKKQESASVANSTVIYNADRSDEKILEIISKAKNADKFNALFKGGGTGEDRSASDQALANMIAFYTKDPDQIISIMRKSVLVREKWDNHKTYLRGTAEKAVAGVDGGFDWEESDRKNREYHENLKNKGYQDSAVPPLQIDLPEDLTPEQRNKKEVEPTKDIDNKPDKKPRRGNAQKIADAKEYMLERYHFFKNVVNGYIYIADKETGSYIQMTEHERSTIFTNMQSSGVELPENLFDHLMKSDFIPQVNPINDFFQSLPEWDGVDHITNYLANTIFFADSANRLSDFNYIKKWLVGVPACALSQKVVNDLCLIFKGSQGIGKSTWFKNLLPEVLAEYHVSFKISDKSADTSMIVCSSLIVDMDELEDLSKRDDGEIKKLISQKTFKIRKPYDRLPNTYYRYGSFCGSVNDDTFLKDPTGSRRYIVLNTKKFDFEAIKQYDKVKIWAQIYHLFKTGFQFWLTQEENAEISRRNAVYMVVNPEDELLTAKFEPGDKEDYTHRMSATEILQYLDVRKIDNRAIKAMSAALKRHGFTQGSIRVKGKTGTRYVYFLKENPKNLYDYEIL